MYLTLAPQSTYRHEHRGCLCVDLLGLQSPIQGGTFVSPIHPGSGVVNRELVQVEKFTVTKSKKNYPLRVILVNFSY